MQQQIRGRTPAEAPSASSTDRAGTLSVTAFRFSGWHDETFHYLPVLSVTASSKAAGLCSSSESTSPRRMRAARRLLKGVRYAAAKRVQPGGTVELVSDGGAADPAEIASPLALASISAIIFFTDDEGQTGIVSAVAQSPRRARSCLPRLTRDPDFTVGRREHRGRFLYWPKLTIAETSGRSRASIKKIVFELLDVGAPRRPGPLDCA